MPLRCFLADPRSGIIEAVGDEIRSSPARRNPGRSIGSVPSIRPAAPAPGVRPIMNDLDELFQRLQRSPFRHRFRLRAAERAYLDRKGLDVVLMHAGDFIDKRLAPANPANDGRQTPMRNHPVFIAQHATATCCRGCLEKWHAIPKGRELSAEEKQYVVGVIRRWLLSQTKE